MDLCADKDRRYGSYFFCVLLVNDELEEVFLQWGQKFVI